MSGGICSSLYKHRTIQNSSQGLFSGEGEVRGAGRRPGRPRSSLLPEWQKYKVPTIPRAGTLFLPRMSSMKRAILSRLQPFLARPRSRSEVAIKGQHGGFGGMQVPGGGLRGMQVPGGSSQPQVGLQGLGDAEHPPSTGMVQPLCES